MSTNTKSHENSLPIMANAKKDDAMNMNSSLSGETIHNNVTAEEATNEFFGYIVQLDCGDDGTYQGCITEVQPATNGTSAWGKVKLEKPSRNGVLLGGDDMAIMVPGELIQDIKVLHIPDSSPPKPKLANVLPSKTRAREFSGYVPVKKVTQYTPKTSSTSLNKSKPIQHLFNVFPKYSPSNSSVTRRSPSVAQSILKMKPSAVYNAQILTNYNNKQLRATAEPFVPQQILGRQKKILSITPPPDKEATTSKNADDVPLEKTGEEKEKKKKEKVVKEPKNSKKEPKKSVDEAKSTEEKKKEPKQRKKETKGVDDMANTGMERVKKEKKKKQTDAQEGSSKMKVGKDERNRLAKEKRAAKNAEGKTKSEIVGKKKKKAKKEQKDGKVGGPEEIGITGKAEEKLAVEETEQKELEKVDEEKSLEMMDAQKINEEKDGTPAEGNEEEQKEEEQEEILATEEQLMNEVAEILENVTTGIGNIEIDGNGDSSETAEIQINSSSTSAYQTTSSNEEQLDEQTENENQSEELKSGEFVGMLASIKTEMGVYQGIVAEIHPAERSLALEKALLNGNPLGAKLIVLNSSVMKDIKLFGNGNSCYGTPNKNVHEWEGKRAGNGPLYSPSVNNRQYSPQQQRASSPLNTTTMSNHVFMQSMPLTGPRSPIIHHQTPPPSMSYGKRRNFDNNNRQSPTRPAAEWAHRQSPRTFIRRSVPPQTPPTPPAQLAHEAYGDYKKFIQPQVPTPPVRPRVNNATINSSRRNCGPTGIPAMDCMNGYNEVLNSEDSTILGAPLDHTALNTDFDFAGNLALFNKKEFAEKTERVFYGLNTTGNNSRNYRNDENVLMDPSRITSWTSPSSSNWLYGQPANALDQNTRNNNHRMQQQPRSRPSTRN